MNQDATYRPPPVPHTCTSSMADTTGLTAATKPSVDQSTCSLSLTRACAHAHTHTHTHSPTHARTTHTHPRMHNTHTQKTLLVTAVYHVPVTKRQAMETVRGRHGGWWRKNGLSQNRDGGREMVQPIYANKTAPSSK